MHYISFFIRKYSQGLRQILYEVESLMTMSAYLENMEEWQVKLWIILENSWESSQVYYICETYTEEQTNRIHTNCNRSAQVSITVDYTQRFFKNSVD